MSAGIAVSDTSAIRALHHLDLLDLLREFFGQVYVPPAVEAELARGTAVLAAVHVARFPSDAIRDEVARRAGEYAP